MPRLPCRVNAQRRSRGKGSGMLSRRTRQNQGDVRRIAGPAAPGRQIGGRLGLPRTYARARVSTVPSLGPPPTGRGWNRPAPSPGGSCFGGVRSWSEKRARHGRVCGPHGARLRGAQRRINPRGTGGSAREPKNSGRLERNFGPGAPAKPAFPPSGRSPGGKKCGSAAKKIAPRRPSPPPSERARQLMHRDYLLENK